MKKISRRSFLKIAGISAAVAGLTACGADSAESTSTDATSTSASTADDSSEAAAGASLLTIGWWGVPDVHEYLLEAGDYFTDETGIALESTYLSWADYWQKLTVLAASNELPDIIRHDPGQIRQWASKGLIEPLDAYVENGTIDLSNVSAALVDTGRVDGVLYGLNVGSNALICISNLEVIEEAGMTPPDETFTIDQYEAWQIEFAQKTGKYATTIQFYCNAHIFFESELRCKGLSLYNDDGTLGFAESDVVTFFDRVKRLHDAKAIPGIDVLSEELNAQDTQFTKSNCANEIIWTDTADAVVNALGKEVAFTLVPGTGPNNAMYLKASQLNCIAANSQYKDDAAKYLDMWTNDADFNAIIAGRRGVPINPEIADGVKETLNELSTRIFDYIALAQEHSAAAPIVTPVAATEVTAAYKDAIASVLYGQATSADAAATFYAKSVQALADSAV